MNKQKNFAALAFFGTIAVAVAAVLFGAKVALAQEVVVVEKVVLDAAIDTEPAPATPAKATPAPATPAKVAPAPATPAKATPAKATPAPATELWPAEVLASDLKDLVPGFRRDVVSEDDCRKVGAAICSAVLASLTDADRSAKNGKRVFAMHMKRNCRVLSAFTAATAGTSGATRDDVAEALDMLLDELDEVYKARKAVPDELVMLAGQTALMLTTGERAAAELENPGLGQRLIWWWNE